MQGIPGPIVPLGDLTDVTLTTETNGDILTFVEGVWENRQPVVSSVFGRTGVVTAQDGDYSLDQLSNVNAPSAINQQFLKFNGTEWVPELLGFNNTGNGAQSYKFSENPPQFRTLFSNSPTISIVQNVDEITFDFVPQEGDYSLDLLSDVTLTSPVQYDVLQHDGTDFKNKILPIYEYRDTFASTYTYIPNLYLSANFPCTLTVPTQTVNGRVLGVRVSVNPVTILLNNSLRTRNNTYNGSCTLTHVSNNCNIELVYQNEGFQNTWTIKSMIGKWQVNGVDIFCDVEDIGEIKNVVITAPTNGQILSYNGTNWINSTSTSSSTPSMITFNSDTNLSSGLFFRKQGLSGDIRQCSYVFTRSATINVLTGWFSTNGGGSPTAGWRYTLYKNSVSTGVFVEILGPNNKASVSTSISVVQGDIIQTRVDQINGPNGGIGAVSIQYV